MEDKKFNHISDGLIVDLSELNQHLFDWQKVIVRWALAKGRCAIFAGCGMGKTAMQLEWASILCKRTKGTALILAPIAVSRQTKEEGIKFGIDVTIVSDKNDVVLNSINITNYEKMHKMDLSVFDIVVLDESSCLKSFTSKYRNLLVDSFRHTRYRLCCTATPSPNDYIELGNHAEFLGVMKRSEMLSMFFINDTADTGKWRLKGHVEQNIFWNFIASWAVVMQKPSDIGFSDDAFILPECIVHYHIIESDPFVEDGFLFAKEAITLTERRKARKNSLGDRVKYAASLVNNSDDLWCVWCNLNDESTHLTSAIVDSVEVTGSDSENHKMRALVDFAHGKIKCLVTKPLIAGFGMNFQVCHNIIFVGLSDSYEQYYQAIRRFWRFGQEYEVNAHVIIGKQELPVLKNIKRKENDMNRMFDALISNMKDLIIHELKGTSRRNTSYNPCVQLKIPNWLKGE